MPFFTDRTIVAGGNFTQITQIPPVNNGRKLLAESIADGAHHDSAERYDAATCHPNTRTSVIGNIVNWLNGVAEFEHMIKWLEGPAGAGKSSIVQTVAIRCARECTLGASFFFKRAHGRRGIAKHLVATLAYQLCETIPETRPHIEAAVDLDHSFLSRSFLTQFTKLIIQPVHAVAAQIFRPLLIAIDGLDECEDPKIQVHLIELLVTICRDHPSLPLRFLLTSRPEYHIETSILSLAKPTPIICLNLQDYAVEADRDIRLYLDAKFETIRAKHNITAAWPTVSDIENIITLSSCQFIFSSTVISYVDSADHQPEKRLHDIFQNVPLSTEENPFASLDALYFHIFSGVPAHHLEAVKDTLSWRISGEVDEYLATHAELVTPERCSCGRYITILDQYRKVEAVMGYDAGEIQACLRHLSSVVRYNGTHFDQDGIHLKILHLSLADFLGSEHRSGPFFLGSTHTQLLRFLGRILTVSLQPFLQGDLDKMSTVVYYATDISTICRCQTFIHWIRAQMLFSEDLLSIISPYKDAFFTQHFDILSRIDFAKFFNFSPNRAHIGHCYLGSILHLLSIYTGSEHEAAVQTILSPVDVEFTRILLTNYSPSLMDTGSPADLIQLLLNNEHDSAITRLWKQLQIRTTIYRHRKRIRSSGFAVLHLAEIGSGRWGTSYYHYIARILKCAYKLSCHPSWAVTISDPRYQLKLVMLQLFLPRRTGDLHTRWSPWNQYKLTGNMLWDLCHARILTSTLLKSAYSMEVTLILRVIKRGLGRTQKYDRELDVLYSAIQGYIWRHRYCDETCEKARHNNPLEQVTWAWKDWRKDFKKHGLRSICVSIRPLRVLL